MFLKKGDKLMQPTSKPGLVHLYCGDGKGKTTAAMGLALRALGAGHSVTILQFLKDGSSAELAPLRTLGARVLAGQTGSRFVFQMTEAERAQTRQYQSELLRTVLADPCDLLILDDLGSEMTTAFVQSALYQIVNTRLMERRSTIINTNLSPEKLAQRYTPQIASRLLGTYELLLFAGNDIRLLKKT